MPVRDVCATGWRSRDNFARSAFAAEINAIFAAKSDRMNTKAKGYLLGAVAAATYGMNPLFALPLYKAGMDPDSVLFFRYLFAIPLLGTMLKARGRDFKLHRREIVPLVLLGLLVALSSLSLFLSYNYMDAGIASTLLFVYPIFVALIMAFGFREKLSPQTALCILLALAGIGLLFKGSDGSTLNITGTVLVMVSALSYAIYIVGVNRPVLKSVATLKVTFYVLLFGLLLYVVRLDFGMAVHVPDNGTCGGTCSHWLFSRRRSRFVYYQRHPVHRFDADGNPRRPGARHGRLLRGDDLRGDPHAADMLRHLVDYHRREPDRRGEPGCGLRSAVQKTFPAASPEKGRPQRFRQP